MAGINLEFGIENAQEVAASLALLENLPEYLRNDILGWASWTLRSRLQGTMQYPPPPSGSTYHRTGQLGSRWTIREAGSGMYAFENPTPYAGYVVGDEQAWMHRGRWWKASERIEEQVVELALLLDRKLRAWPN